MADKINVMCVMIFFHCDGVTFVSANKQIDISRVACVTADPNPEPLTKLQVNAQTDPMQAIREQADIFMPVLMMRVAISASRIRQTATRRMSLFIKESE